MDDYLSSHWRVNSLNDRSLGMILIDIDDFKRYNDIYGHRQGDACLVKVSQILRDTLTELGQDTLARYGGEEFAVIVSDIEDRDLFAIAEKLRTAVEATAIEHKGSRASSVVTISLGCTNLIPSGEIEPEALIDAAAKALFRAKSGGRNKTQLYSVSDDIDNVGWGPRLVD